MSDPTTPPGPRSKRATRQTLRVRRDALTPEERAAASERIARAANAVIDQRLAAGDVLAVYAAKGSEVDATAIVEHALARGLRVAYPRVQTGDRMLAFHLVTDAELVTGTLGLRQPNADAPRIDVAQIAAFVVPGLAFDRDGGRTGWGMGHYDATLAHAPGALRIGIAYECQLVDHVPREAHDIPMTHVVTEAATYEVGHG